MVLIKIYNLRQDDIDYSHWVLVNVLKYFSLLIYQAFSKISCIDDLILMKVVRVNIIFSSKGLEPRLIKAGKHKMRINPFQPENPEDIAWVTDFMSEVHNNFKKLVRERRKSLDLNHKTVFEADIFSGQNAMKIGLIDGLHSDMNKLLKDRYGESVVIRRMEPKSKFPFGLDKFGAEVKLDTDNLLHSVSEASMVPRYKFF